MGFFSKLNKRTFTHQIDTKDFQYFKLEALHKAAPDKVHRIHALYKSDAGKFGPSYSALLDKCFVNLPQHMNDQCDDIVASDEAVELINEGKCGIKTRTYTDKNGVERYSVEWVDME